MRGCFSSLLLLRRRRSSKTTLAQRHPNKDTRGSTPTTRTSNTGKSDGLENMQTIDIIQNSSTNNIIMNHDFSEGLHSWHPNCCEAYVASHESGLLSGVEPNSGVAYAVVTKRTESWQGLEQDITEKVALGAPYTVSAIVRIHGDLQGTVEVQATLKLEYHDSTTKYAFVPVGRTLVSGECWKKLEGTFSLTSMPNRVLFYLEGPSAGVNLLIDSVMLSSAGQKHSENTQTTDNTQNSSTNNIIVNHDFSEGLHSWHPNCCEAYVASHESGLLSGVEPNSGVAYAVVTKRTESWQGLEQDITEKVALGAPYTVSAIVRIHGDLQGTVEVQATLKLEYHDSTTKFAFVPVGRTLVSGECWKKLEGTFSLTSMPNRVIFYLEGPSPGVNLLIDSVMLSSAGQKHSEEFKVSSAGDDNIVRNPQFEDGLSNWSGRGCKILLHKSTADGRVLPLHGVYFASATNRSENWNGIQQDITGKVRRKLAYEVSAVVRISGNGHSGDVKATLWVQAPNGREQYIGIGSVQASNQEWLQLKGKFLLNGVVSKAVIYLEGPPAGVDILVDNLVVRRAKKLSLPAPLKSEGFRDASFNLQHISDSDIILNHDFSQGLHFWSLNCCDGHVVSRESDYFKGAAPRTGTCYAAITNRKEEWHGLEQDITGRISCGFTYMVSAYVRVWGEHREPVGVIGTLRLENPDSHTSYLFIGRVLASNERWEKLEGSFALEKMPKRVVFYIEGPPPGIDLLIDSVVISLPTPKQSQNALFGANIIENSTFNDGLKSWSPLGSCIMNIRTGSPQLFPSLASYSLGDQQSLSGRYVLTSNRSETWMGPSQTVTDKIKLHLTYQVAAWVRVGSGAKGSQNIGVSLNVDNQWINAGQVEVNDHKWHELSGSFKIEKQPSKVVVYLQGPLRGVDLMLAGLTIFPVDRKARFNYLKKQTDKVRKRDVIIKLQEPHGGSFFGVPVKIKQIQNSFPFGSCINRSNSDNEEFVDFFVKNFNWAVFGNELKWYHTEPQQGKLNYHDADEMLEFCERHGMETRGHCIFWEVEDAVQPWVRSLKGHELMAAINSRLRSLLSRYRGRFRHYDVNNEMLHGSFYQDRLGRDIRAYMFREAHQLDPAATLFVNDYHVEDGCDAMSSPEKYIDQILELQERGAPVGGIGIQGHIDHPVGPIVCAALDKLAVLGLPIWFTELDVCAVNEHVRAEDLEVMLREAYAHPAVEGIVLWGFWEMFMCRDHSHLVDAEGDVNEAGKRYLALREEWLSHAAGHIDANGEFLFRGYEGTYTIDIDTPDKKSSSFVVPKGQDPLVLPIKI